MALEFAEKKGRKRKPNKIKSFSFSSSSPLGDLCRIPVLTSEGCVQRREKRTSSKDGFHYKSGVFLFI